MPKETNFWESAKYNNATFLQYYNRLVELNLSVFDWQNLPDTVDPRFLELCLFGEGRAIFFKDEVVGECVMRTTVAGRLDIYGIPLGRRAYAVNGYNKELDETNSVIIFNNMLHTSSRLDVELFSRKLWDLDRAIDVNAKAQKTPVLIACEESQRLTMKNLYMQYEGNTPVIYGDKNLNPNALKVLNTQAPYVADKLYTLKTQIWNEALTYLGIPNLSVEKKERLVTGEVNNDQADAMAYRNSKLYARQEACDKINKMFGLNIWCEFKEEKGVVEKECSEENKGGEDNE